MKLFFLLLIVHSINISLASNTTTTPSSEDDDEDDERTTPRPSKSRMRRKHELSERICRGVESKFEPDQLNVEVEMNLLEFDLDVADEIVTVQMEITLYWSNNNFVWDPSSPDNLDVETVTCLASEIWTPDLYLSNNADVPRLRTHVLSETRKEILVESDGNITLQDTYRMKANCDLNMYHFPFDKHECTLSFRSWKYDASEMRVTTTNMRTRNSTTLTPTEDYDENYVWKLEKMTLRSLLKKFSWHDAPFSILELRMNLERIHPVFVINIVIPCAILAVLSLLVFLLPEDCGEKMGYCITILLAITVFQQFTMDSLPKSGVPYITSFYLIVMILNALTLVLTTMTLWFHHSTRPPSAKLYRAVVVRLGWLVRVSGRHGRASRLKKCNSVIPLQYVVEKEDASTSDKPPQEAPKEIDEPPEEEDCDIAEDWKDINTVLNRIFFMVFLLVLIAAFIAIFVTP